MVFVYLRVICPPPYSFIPQLSNRLGADTRPTPPPYSFIPQVSNRLGELTPDPHQDHTSTYHRYQTGWERTPDPHHPHTRSYHSYQTGWERTPDPHHPHTRSYHRYQTGWESWHQTHTKTILVHTTGIKQAGSGHQTHTTPILVHTTVIKQAGSGHQTHTTPILVHTTGIKQAGRADTRPTPRPYSFIPQVSNRLGERTPDPHHPHTRSYHRYQTGWESWHQTHTTPILVHTTVIKQAGRADTRPTPRPYSFIPQVSNRLGELTPDPHQDHTRSYHRYQTGWESGHQTHTTPILVHTTGIKQAGRADTRPTPPPYSFIPQVSKRLGELTPDPHHPHTRSYHSYQTGWESWHQTHTKTILVHTTGIKQAGSGQQTHTTPILVHTTGIKQAGRADTRPTPRPYSFIPQLSNRLGADTRPTPPPYSFIPQVSNSLGADSRPTPPPYSFIPQVSNRLGELTPDSHHPHTRSYHRYQTGWESWHQTHTTPILVHTTGIKQAGRADTRPTPRPYSFISQVSNRLGELTPDPHHPHTRSYHRYQTGWESWHQTHTTPILVHITGIKQAGRADTRPTPPPYSFIPQVSNRLGELTADPHHPHTRSYHRYQTGWESWHQTHTKTILVHITGIKQAGRADTRPTPPPYSFISQVSNRLGELTPDPHHPHTRSYHRYQTGWESWHQTHTTPILVHTTGIKQAGRADTRPTPPPYSFIPQVSNRLGELTPDPHQDHTRSYHRYQTGWESWQQTHTTPILVHTTGIKQAGRADTRPTPPPYSFISQVSNRLGELTPDPHHPHTRSYHRYQTGWESWHQTHTTPILVHTTGIKQAGRADSRPTPPPYSFIPQVSNRLGELTPDPHHPHTRSYHRYQTGWESWHQTHTTPILVHTTGIKQSGSWQQTHTTPILVHTTGIKQAGRADTRPTPPPYSFIPQVSNRLGELTPDPHHPHTRSYHRYQTGWESWHQTHTKTILVHITGIKQAGRADTRPTPPPYSFIPQVSNRLGELTPDPHHPHTRSYHRYQTGWESWHQTHTTPILVHTTGIKQAGRADSRPTPPPYSFIPQVSNRLGELTADPHHPHTRSYHRYQTGWESGQQTHTTPILVHTTGIKQAGRADSRPTPPPYSFIPQVSNRLGERTADPHHPHTRSYHRYQTGWESWHQTHTTPILVHTTGIKQAGRADTRSTPPTSRNTRLLYGVVCENDGKTKYENHFPLKKQNNNNNNNYYYYYYYYYCYYY